MDALSSHQTREKKLAIMKDANCGAFAVIYGGVYLLAYAGFAYEVFAAGHILLICPLFVLSRALSGLCAVNLPNARKSGMLCAFTSGVQPVSYTHLDVYKRQAQFRRAGHSAVRGRGALRHPKGQR